MGILHISVDETELRIFEALVDLVSGKDYTKPTVALLCRKANISRTTFYYHFACIEDIAVWYASITFKIGLDEVGRTLDWRTGHYLTMLNYSRYMAPLERISAVHSLESPYNRMFQHRIDNLTQTVVEYKKEDLTSHMRFLIDSTVEVEFALARKWIRGAYGFTVDEYCDEIVQAIPREMFDLLNEPSLSPGEALVLIPSPER